MSWSILALAHSDTEITDRNRTREEGGQFLWGKHWDLTLSMDWRCSNIGNILEEQLGMDDLMCTEGSEEGNGNNRSKMRANQRLH